VRTQKQSQFCYRVYRATRKIPRGRVATYARVAWLAGFPRAARAAGNALSKNYARLLYATSYDNDHNDDWQKFSHSHCQKSSYSPVPCHRVVCSDGSVGGFARGARAKVTMLEKEGVEVKRGKVDLARFEWRRKSC